MGDAMLVEEEWKLVVRKCFQDHLKYLDLDGERLFKDARCGKAAKGRHAKYILYDRFVHIVKQMKDWCAREQERALSSNSQSHTNYAQDLQSNLRQYTVAARIDRQSKATAGNAVQRRAYRHTERVSNEVNVLIAYLRSSEEEEHMIHGALMHYAHMVEMVADRTYWIPDDTNFDVAGPSRRQGDLDEELDEAFGVPLSKKKLLTKVTRDQLMDAIGNSNFVNKYGDSVTLAAFRESLEEDLGAKAGALEEHTDLIQSAMFRALNEFRQSRRVADAGLQLKVLSQEAERSRPATITLPTLPPKALKALRWKKNR